MQGRLWLSLILSGKVMRIKPPPKVKPQIVLAKAA